MQPRKKVGEHEQPLIRQKASSSRKRSQRIYKALWIFNFKVSNPFHPVLSAPTLADLRPSSTAYTQPPIFFAMGVTPVESFDKFKEIVRAAFEVLSTRKLTYVYRTRSARISTLSSTSGQRGVGLAA